MLSQLRRLLPGDAVAIVSPASWPEDEGVAALADRLDAWGLRAVVGEHVADRRGYLAGRDEHRAADLNAAIRDPAIRAIVATRGGCGSFRLVRDLDLAALAEDPKPILGYSDITAVHHLWATVGVPSLHGAIAGAHADDVRHLLLEGAPTLVRADPDALPAGLTTTGRVDGMLSGGSLEMLARSVGVVPFELEGRILLLEINRAAGLGMVDRALTQLILSGSLDGITGVALGSVEDFAGFEDRGWDILDVLHDRLGGLSVPILGGLPLGHLADPVTVPLGIPAVLDADAGTLSIAAAVGA